jgi:catechol 2,3-dioxygenase-like lactoylglutathione lyase family enzyme
MERAHWESMERRTTMIFGAHVILYSRDAEADRAFLRDVLGFSTVDAGHGWLIFALPPAEAAVHPAEENGRHELYLLSNDLEGDMGALEKKGIHCSAVLKERWGSITRIQLPGGGTVGLYQPTHDLAIPQV